MRRSLILSYGAPASKGGENPRSFAVPVDHNCCMSAMPTVLIVDDHAAFRTSARRLLSADGFSVIGEATDGEAAVEAARRLRPDIVLLDVQLPGIDGFAVARRILGDGSISTQVVITSSRDRGDYGVLVEQCGAVGFIPKDELSGARLAELTT